MLSLRSQVKVLLVAYVALSPLWGPAAEAAFHLERAEDVGAIRSHRIVATPVAPPKQVSAHPAFRKPAPRTVVAASLPPAHVIACESKGSYTAENPVSTASGRYQIVDGTWNGYGGYSHASHAPPHVQDAKAAELWDGGRGASHWRQCL
jgi:hypothetical protein